MRDNLNGSAEISASSFACDNVAVNSSGSIVAGLGALDIGESFIMTEVEVGFGAVVGNENLSVLIR